ncbi:hypothetical protein IFM89_027939 [Coptis chinensis]|uniref:BHLH domain-containing protein n=1 Tax=Coptis chinensis TaxID=261450 RepID=A0A835M1Y3_9MAGN|nr:hypothetical protein IFM89_027939 [Coptis chinensis]
MTPLILSKNRLIVTFLQSLEIEKCYGDRPVGKSTLWSNSSGTRSTTEFVFTSRELHKALGPSLQQSCNDYLWIPNGSGDDVRSSLICNTDFTGSREPSAGCSIDSLLDQTIKHMMFLRSVTNRNGEVKAAVDKKNLELFEDQGKENGASWAIEMGSQLEVCPIVVKDLEQPGHMLIEINKLLERVEATFIKHFANANRSKGINILRPKAKRERHRVTYSLGSAFGRLYEEKKTKYEVTTEKDMVLQRLCLKLETTTIKYKDVVFQEIMPQAFPSIAVFIALSRLVLIYTHAIFGAFG